MPACQILSNVPKFTGFRKESPNQSSVDTSGIQGSFVLGSYSDFYSTEIPVVYNFTCEGSPFTITQNIPAPSSSTSHSTKYTDLLPYTAKSSGSGNYFTTARLMTSLNPVELTDGVILILQYGVNIEGTGVLRLQSMTMGGTPLQGIANFIYPVGSIYMSVNSTSPATLFGGTWEQLKDRFLLGAGDTYTAGSIGGEANHTLTVAELPSHWHKTPSITGGSDGYNADTIIASDWVKTAGYYHTVGTASEGQNTPHNNMPPYLVVYMWKRTA